MAEKFQMKIPVLCTAKVSEETLNSFFAQANACLNDHCYEEAQDVLVSTIKPPALSEPAKPTTVPISKVDTSPFLGWKVDEIISWAKEHLTSETGLSQENTFILDGKVEGTCLLVSLNDWGNECIKVRSDFSGALVRLMVKETAVGGDQHLEDVDEKGGLRMQK